MSGCVYVDTNKNELYGDVKMCKKIVGVDRNELCRERVTMLLLLFPSTRKL